MEGLYKMNILVMSNLPGLSVGYGTLSMKLLPLFKKDHNVDMFVNYGLQGGGFIYLRDFPGIRFYGQGEAGFNEHLVEHRYNEVEADIFLPMYDCWALNITPVLAQQGKIIVVPYFPVDSDVLNEDHIRFASACWKIIPMSWHGERLFREKFPEQTLPHIRLSSFVERC